MSVNQSTKAKTILPAVKKAEEDIISDVQTGGVAGS